VVRSIALRTGTVSWNIAFTMAEYRLDSFAIAFLVIGNKISPVPFLLKRDDFREIINLKLLILWRVGIIESPLL
jgi:hypothetical protein